MIDTDFPTQEQFDGFVRFLDAFVSSLPRIALIAAILVISAYLLWQLALLTLRVLEMRHLLRRDLLFLELTPPAFYDKTPEAHKQLFETLHGNNDTRTLQDKLLLRRMAFSVELVGTREQGIRYIFCVPKESRDSFEKAIAGFGTDIRVKEVGDYLTKAQRLRARLLEFKLKNRYYPLQGHESFEQADPVGYLLTAMANLQPGEVMALQFVLSPTTLRQVDKICNRLLHNKEHLDALGKRHHKSLGGVLKDGISSALLGVTSAAGDVYHGPSKSGKSPQYSTASHYKQVAAGIRPERDMGSLEEELAQQVSEKLNGDLFLTNIRALVVASKASLAKGNDIRKSFNVYRTSRQAIKSRFNFPYNLRTKYRRFAFEHRLPGLFGKNCCLLSAKEVSDIYHFPNSTAVHNGDVAHSFGKALAPPLAIRSRADKGNFDVVLGRNIYHGNITNIGLIADERERHMYVIGATGSGKTTLLKYAILQDILSGKGAAVIDPHGDMAMWLLKYIPKERIKDVIYLYPKEISSPIGMNLLELPPGLEGDELLIAKDFVTEAIVSIFRKVFSDDDTGGHRIEHVLRNAIHTAFYIEGATLFTIRKLLNDAEYRKQIVPKLEDEYLKDFWLHEFGLAGDYQKYKSMDGVITKIGRFQLSAVTRRMLEQKESTISFDDIMNSGKILICNLAKGAIGEDTSEVIGTTVLAKLQLAAYRRIEIEEDDRRPFHLYVDECQNFISPLFTQILSESRKYKFFLTMAEQSTSQQDRDLTENILDNAGTVVCFRTGNPADEELMLHQFKDRIEEGEIMRLPKHNFYIRIGAGDAPETFSGETILITDQGSKEIANLVKKTSKELYSKPYTPPPKPEPKKEELKPASETIKKTTGGKDTLKRRRSYRRNRSA